MLTVSFSNPPTDSETASGRELARSHTFLIHLPTGRPLCVLLQAAFRADHEKLARFFAGSTWLTAPPQDGKVVRVTGTAEEWRAHVERIENTDG